MLHLPATAMAHNLLCKSEAFKNAGAQALPLTESGSLHLGKGLATGISLERPR